ncbi:MAG: carboxypeptidase regulatory-like domain-containing protein [Acidobacteriota bacterium]|nr:carboxypeptidase regulatory-like domain-containing protein [Acidobacteriota bacterium]
MTSRWKAGLPGALLAVLLFVQAGFAQVTAAVSGTVEDASGGALSGVTVTATSLETGLSRIATTGKNGTFRVLSLPVGPLEVSAEKQNFKRTVRTGINLIVGQEAVVNLRLQLGSLKQEVTVSAESPLVNIAPGEVSGFVGERAVKDLPLNGRSWDNLIALNPGAVNYGLKSANTTTSNGNTFTVAGRRPMDNLVLLNGIEYTGASLTGVTPGGVSGGLLGIDAVREFNVLTDTYSAQYGKRSGGQVSVVTQSGTNELHGTLFEFLRNSAVDARNYFDNGPVPPLRRNQFGGALGGPLKKDKLFLFGNYEAFRQSLSVSNVAVVPDAQARQGLLPNTAGVYGPVANLDRSMLTYMSFWPDPNGPELTSGGRPGGTALSFNSPKQNIREDFGTVRSDYVVRNADTFSFAYTVDDGSSLTPLGDPLFGSDLRLRNQVASLQEVHIFSPQALNTFRAGFSRAAFNYDSFPLAKFSPDLSFVQGSGPGGLVVSGGLTTTGLSAITAAGPNNAANVASHRNLFTWSDDFQISLGKHQISAGVWFQRLQDNENSASVTLGQANFTSLRSFLQGTVSNFNVTPDRTGLGWRTFLGAWYLDDKIRLLPNLTAEIGLRHEFTAGWNEVAGRAANYVTDAQGVLLTNPRVGSSALTRNNATRLFGPRVGLAWDPFGNGKTAVRAGFGIYYSLLDSLSRLDAIPPFNGTLAFSNVPLSSIVPIDPKTPPQPSCGPALLTGCVIYSPQGIQPDSKTPTVERWSFRIEQELDAKTVLRVGYVGSFGYHDLVSVDPNSIPAQVCMAAAGCVSGGTSPVQGHVPAGAEYISTGKRPNPFLSSGFFWYSEGNSSYHALELDVVRRLAQGLQVRGNFTWSKNLDMNSALIGAQANNEAQMVMDRNNLRRDWGPSALDPAAQSSISANYALPIGGGQRFFAHNRSFTNALLDGWEVNGIATLLSGFPFTPQVGSNRSGDGDTRNPDRPSLNPSFTGPVVLGTQRQWFNPNAFILPAPGTWGNVGRGDYRGPGLASVDLSLFKNISLAERDTLQFRVECFNVANRANFGTPNAIVFLGGTVSPSAGLITNTVTTSRQLQFGLKLIF